MGNLLHWAGNNTSPEPIETNFTEEYMHHQGQVLIPGFFFFFFFF